VHQLANWWLISIRADLLYFWPLIVCLVGFFFWRTVELYLPQPSLSTAFSSLIHVARFSRVCMRMCTQAEFGLLYSTTYTKYSLLDDLLFISPFGN
jgi:hypothetical protein